MKKGGAFFPTLQKIISNPKRDKRNTNRKKKENKAHNATQTRTNNAQINTEIHRDVKYNLF